MKNSGRKVGGFFDKWDYFGEPIPNFNIEGATKLGSSIGLLFSIAMWLIIIGYASLKGIYLFSRYNP